MFEFEEFLSFNPITQITPNQGITKNPSILSKITKTSFGILYTKPYALKELNLYRLFFTHQSKSGIGFTTFNQKGYGEYQLALAKSFSLKERFFYGLILKLLYLDLKEYGKEFAPALNIGTLFTGNNYRLGLVLENLNRPKIMNDFLKSSLTLGLSHNPFQNLVLFLSFEKSQKGEGIFAGVEMSPTKTVALSFITHTNPLIFATGISFKIREFSLDYTYRFHPQLSGTNIIGLSFSF